MNKTLILDEFCEVCGHHRKHAVRLLNKDGRKKKKKPGRPTTYGPEVLSVIENIWLNADRPCAARLVGMIPIWLPAYEKRRIAPILAPTVKKPLYNALCGLDIALRHPRLGPRKSHRAESPSGPVRRMLVLQMTQNPIGGQQRFDQIDIRKVGRCEHFFHARALESLNRRLA
ncbi:MAG: hypothetical protein OSB41_00545 [Kiritimatiellae bacterium]|nr:hypothetical protein [Kiritimatiellia bacterium]